MTTQSELEGIDAQGIWRNFSGSITSRPGRTQMPATEDALIRFVREGESAGEKIRVVGAGHSCTPLVSTAGALVSLDRLHGVLSTDPARATARIAAGTKISALGVPLRAAGLATINQGDVDVQAPVSYTHLTLPTKA